MPKKTIRLAIAQMNPTVGDYAGNSKKIIFWIKKASKAGADLVVFPEMAVSGYPVWDLANKKRFVEQGLKHLKRIASVTRGKKIAAVAGFIDRSDKKSQPGSIPERSYNALAWMEKGKIRAVQHKRLLPNYDVFLEQIFFNAGKKSTVISWKGKRTGLSICEDVWDQGYEAKPLAELSAQKADFLINISASPFYTGVGEVRNRLLKRQAVHYKFPILYVNQVGGQDDLIFDGRSMLVDEKGRVLFRAPAFEEGLYFYDWNSGDQSAKHIPFGTQETNPEEMYRALTLGVKDYCRKNGFKKVLVGLSGGIDSALVATVAKDALGADCVKAVTMPSAFSSQGSWKDSQELAANLGIECCVHPIRKRFDHFMNEDRNFRLRDRRKILKKGQITLAMENLQARLRGLELMYLSNDESRLLLSTGNKSELAMGYCTLYGDMCGGLNVLGDVYKTDVYRLARYRNSLGEVIPRAILEKAPSAELRPNQKDQDSLPPYEVLDDILYRYIEENQSLDEISRDLKVQNVKMSDVFSVIRKVDHNEYKRRQTPPILRVTRKAWFGRRMPITNRFEK